jgi:hypothetical protein
VNSAADLNHPIDVQFNTTSVDGWPFIVCEVLLINMPQVLSYIGVGLGSFHGGHERFSWLWLCMGANWFDEHQSGDRNLEAHREQTN